MSAGIQRIDTSALDGMHDMGDIIVAAVGDSGTEIGYLKGSGSDLTLTDGDGNDGKGVPRTAISLVVILGIGNHSSSLSREVDAKFIAETHADEVVLPTCHGTLH